MIQPLAHQIVVQINHCLIKLETIQPLTRQIEIIQLLTHKSVDHSIIDSPNSLTHQFMNISLGPSIRCLADTRILSAPRPQATVSTDHPFSTESRSHRSDQPPSSPATTERFPLSEEYRPFMGRDYHMGKHPVLSPIQI